MEMYDKVSRPSERCRMCGHERLKYYEFPCKDCVYNGGGGDMFVAKETLSSAGTIKDSGERRVFETGAVRDCAEGKGRCDLLPLREVAQWMNDPVIDEIASFVETHDVFYLWEALNQITSKHFSCKADLVLEMAIHMEEGLKKYPERNWENGISIHSFVDSGVRHYLKVLRRDDDENHMRACVWNLMCCIWTMHNKPEMDDLPKVEDKTND